MRRHGLGLAGLLVLAAAWWGLGNVPPTMEDQYVTTVQDTPVVFELRAKDEDIDPNDPEAHRLRFVLVEGPRRGVLIGDLTEVTYEGPHDAVVKLTYVPAAGFVGRDLARIVVYDPCNETASGTVTIQIDVARRRAEGLLSGNWSITATYIPDSTSFTAFASQLAEVYRVGPLTTKATARLRKAVVGGVDRMVFEALRLDGAIKVGVMSLASTLTFNPQAADPGDRFDYWRTTVGFTVGGMSIQHTLYLTKPLALSHQTLYVQGTAGSLSFTNTLRMGVNDACGFEFARDEGTIGWSWCDLDIVARFSVTCGGLEKAEFKLADLPISSRLPELMLDAGLTFAMEAKTLWVEMSWRPATVECVRLYGQLEAGGPSVAVEGFTIYGVRVESEVGGVKVVSATSFTPSKNSTLTGQTDYWEVLRMSGTLDGCCGVSGTWGVATYFACHSTQLFDWGMTTSALDVALTDAVSTQVELVLRSGDLGDPTAELSLRCVVRW